VKTFFTIIWDALRLPHPLRFCGGIIDISPIYSNSHVNQLLPKVDLKVESVVLFVVFFPFFSLVFFQTRMYDNKPRSKNDSVKAPEEYPHVPAVCLECCWVVGNILVLYVDAIKMVGIIRLHRWTFKLQTLLLPLLTS
jgi:hypothetical protein